MQSQNRDTGIGQIKARKNHTCYGMGIGVIILDDVYPGFPGDVRNASAWNFPMQYEICEGIDIRALLWEEDKSPCLDPILRAAKKLERMGCRGIAAECGYFAYFQKAVAGQVDIPVFMSSLLQVPFIQNVIGPQKEVGIFCYQKQFLTETHLQNVGVTPGSNYVIAGAGDEYNMSEFNNLWNWELRPERPESNYGRTEQQIIAACSDFVKKNPKIGAIMLECTGMQPFARAVQRELDVPVYSWGTLLDFAFSAVNHRDYYGHV